MYHLAMAKSKTKQSLLILAVAVLAALAGLAAYAYPRRVVPSIAGLVPSEGMIASIRIAGAGSVWRSCQRSAFGRRVRAGELFPISDLLKRNEDFREEWESLDTSFWPELLGRDFVATVYHEGEGIRAAVWSRVGFKTRLFSLFQRLRGRVCFWRARTIATRREGRLLVTTVLDKKDLTPRYSFSIIGDLGIATTGSAEEFWRNVERVAGGLRPPAEPLLPHCRAPRPDRAEGIFLIRTDAALRYADSLVASRRRDDVSGYWAPLRAAIGSSAQVQGGFTLGSRSEGEIFISARAGREFGRVAERNASTDPLTGPMTDGGILYAGGRCAPADVFSRLCRALSATEIEFQRAEGAVTFPAEHFTLSWLGADCSILFAQAPDGMVNAAVSCGVADRRLARERLERFSSLADKARLCVVSENGREAWGTDKLLKIKRERRGRVIYYRIPLEGALGHIYEPSAALCGDRFIVATSGSFLDELMKKRAISPRPWMTGASSSCVLRGSTAGRAAGQLRELLGLLAPFMRGEGEREWSRVVGEVLGICEWFSPVREAWVVRSGDGRTVRVRWSAEFADSGPQ